MSAQPSNSAKVNLQLEQAILAILSDRPIAYHASLARALGSVTAGVLLSQFLYWQPRSQDSEGWFWKTRDEIYEETALGRREQETARKVLRASGALEEKLRGVPARMHFRVNLTKLVSLLSDGHASAEGDDSPGAGSAYFQFAQSRPTSWAESAQLDGTNQPNQIARNRPTITETTSETTPEITSKTTNSNGFEGEILHQCDGETSFSRKRNFAKNQFAATTAELPQREKRAAPAPIGQMLRDRHGDRLLESPAMAPGSPVGVTNPSRGTESHLDDVQPPLRASRGRGRPPKATEQIVALVEQFSDEFHDDEHAKPNISHAARLWKRSGLSEDAFCSRLYEARSRTKQAPGIEKRATGEAGKWGARNKMPYFFACLEDVLGMRDDAGVDPHRSSSPS